MTKSIATDMLSFKDFHLNPFFINYINLSHVGTFLR